MQPWFDKNSVIYIFVPFKRLRNLWYSILLSFTVGDIVTAVAVEMKFELLDGDADVVDDNVFFCWYRTCFTYIPI